MAKSKCIAGIFDVHVPDHDRALWRAFLKWCRDVKPDEIIIGGDFLELESCSSHGGNPRPPLLSEEITAGKAALRQLREANPRATLTYLEGNHEHRLSRHLSNGAPTLSGSLHLPDLLELRSFGCTWVDYGKVITRGKIGFTHGFWASDAHAKKHLSEYGHSIAYGHTHRPQVYTRGSLAGDVHGAFGMPCMRGLDAQWLHNRPCGWMQGFGVFYVLDDGSFHPYTVLANRSRFVWNGKHYSG